MYQNIIFVGQKASCRNFLDDQSKGENLGNKNAISIPRRYEDMQIMAAIIVGGNIYILKVN